MGGMQSSRVKVDTHDHHCWLQLDDAEKHNNAPRMPLI